MITLIQNGITYNINICGCNNCGDNCGELCTPIFDKVIKCIVSECCGCGVCFDNEQGNLITLNEDLRYVSEWNQ